MLQRQVIANSAILIGSLSVILAVMTGFIHDTKWNLPSPKDIQSIDGVFRDKFPISYIESSDGRHIGLECLPFVTRIPTNCRPPDNELSGKNVHATYFVPQDNNFRKNDGIMLSLNVEGVEYINKERRLKYLSKNHKSYSYLDA